MKMGIEEDRYILNLDDPIVRKRFEETVEQIQREIYPTLIKPLEDGKRLTAADYAITINSPPVEYNS